MEKKKGKVFFILGIIFTAISTIIFAYFLTALIQIMISADSGDAETGLGAVIALIVFLPYWMLLGAASGLISGVLSGIGIRYKKISLLFLILSLIYIAAPFIFILAVGGDSSTTTEEAMLALNSVMTFAL
ncbi:MAG: hypothetical protein J6U25_00955 [Clostridia bacterium]|nr:hypothetical protein [Clostridia bacterium]